MPAWKKTSKVQTDELLSDGQIIADSWWIAGPGNKWTYPGHISLFSPRHGILFPGDSIVSERGRLILPPGCHLGPTKKQMKVPVDRQDWE